MRNQGNFNQVEPSSVAPPGMPALYQQFAPPLRHVQQEHPESVESAVAVNRIQHFGNG